MKTTIQTIWVALVFCGINASAAVIKPYVTTQPNEFYFTSDVYYVQEGATNALVEVAFVPGTSSYSGWVDYKTSNGTAISGQDYNGVTNTLSFSGPAPSKTFMVSVALNSTRQEDKTVLLSLSNPNAMLTRSNATLIIVAKPAPARLDMVQGNGSVTVSWPTTVTNCVLQSATSLADGNWADVPQPATMSSGRFSFTTSATGSAFFRLKQK